MDAFAAGQAILGLDTSPRSMVLMAAMERHMASLLGPSLDYNDEPFWKSHSNPPGVVSRLGREPEFEQGPSIRSNPLPRTATSSYVSARGEAVGRVGWVVAGDSRNTYRRW